MSIWGGSVPVLFAIWLLAAFVFGVGALQGTRRLLHAARLVPDPAAWPALAILRPCAGLDPELEANLASTLEARYDGPREVFFLVASKDDPAYAIAERVRAGSEHVHVVVTAIATRHNRKVAQLAVAEPLSTAPIVAVVDSDLRLDDRTLPGLVRALLADPRAGASSCPPVDALPRTLGDHASSALLSSTPHAFYCLAALAERSGGAHVLCGALIAVRRDVLTELGGFAAFERYLGEDFEMARQLHARGYTIATAAAPGVVTDHGRSLASVLQRYRRWATVTRQQRPHLMITYPLLLACTPLLLVTALGLALLHARFVGALGGGLCVVLALRLALALTLRRAYGRPAGPFRTFAAMILGEVTMLVTAAGALGRPIVSWRGHRYRVHEHGLIETLDEPA